MNTISLATYAMATRFEVVLHGDDPVRLRAAGEEALVEIERIERQLSLYLPDSDIISINAHAADQPVKADPRVFRLLRRCAGLTEQTDGAFDITITPLLRAWGFVGGTGRLPSEDEIETARQFVGMEHVRLDEDGYTVGFDRQGVELDLGAIGKGYAIERAADLLRENGITSALIHGGTSTVCAIGSPPDQPVWKVAVKHPTEDSNPDVVDLRDCSLSVSAVTGKSFTDGETEFGHVLDPRSGRPVQGALLAAVTGPSATDCDALSTALLVLGEQGKDVIRSPYCVVRVA